MISQLASRLGGFQFAENGPSRFFGATSNLHVIGDNPLPEYRSFRCATSTALPDSNDSENPVVCDEMEEHLLNLFFAWEGPLIHIVQQGPFMERWRRQKNQPGGDPAYSEALVSAM